MFEIVLSVCLETAPEVCRDVVLPEGPFVTEDACTAALALRRDGAVCAAAGAPLAFDEVAPGVFVHTGAIAEPDRQNLGDVANLGFVIGETSVAVIDAGTARWIAEATWRAVRAETDLPVSHLILTHVHPDHLLGARFYAEAGAEIVGHGALNRALADRAANYEVSLSRLIGAEHYAGGGAVAATMAVEDIRRIDLGGRVIDLRAWPAAHTETDLTAFDVPSGILFAGDLVFDDHTPALDGSVLGWRDVLDALAGLDVTAVVPGHGGPLLDWPEGGAPLADYLEVLTEDTRQAIAEGQRIGPASQEIAASEAEKWSLFEAFNPRNAIQAFTELEWE